jgi:hypothetical protein
VESNDEFWFGDTRVSTGAEHGIVAAVWVSRPSDCEDLSAPVSQPLSCISGLVGLERGESGDAYEKAERPRFRSPRKEEQDCQAEESGGKRNTPRASFFASQIG